MRASLTHLRIGLLSLLALVATLIPGLVQHAQAQIPQTEYEARRNSLAVAMGEGVLVALGAVYAVDYDFELSQLPAFDYLTGIREPDAGMVLVHEAGDVTYTLFRAQPTVREQLYDGFREAPEALARRTGATVRPLADLVGYVDSLAARGLPFYELRDIRSGDAMARDTVTRGSEFIEGLRTRHPGLQVVDLHSTVAKLRARKSQAEVALLRRAVAITDTAHLAALAAIAPGMWEYEIEAAIEHTFQVRGARPAYSSIVGSGLNSTVLHYVANDRRMGAGDLVLMDIGAEVDGYDADITRTVPVSGTFSADQRAVYDIVLASLKEAEAAVRPGAPAERSLMASMNVRLEGLARLGLIESPDATYDPPWPVDCEVRPDQCLQGMLFMIHGISHGIGLEVHDPVSFYFDGRFSPGDVLTIEPGIYVNANVFDLLPDTPKNRAFIAAVAGAVERYHAIGIRIEDNYLVTESGVERLSTAPREADLVEAAMAGGEIAEAGGHR